MTSKFDWSQFAEPAPSENKSFDWSQFTEEDKEPSRPRSLLSAASRGLIKGAQGLADLGDPLTAAIRGGKSTIPEEVIDRVLPVQKGKKPEEYLEIAGELAPSFAIGPGGIASKALQTGAGALGKLFLKESGAPEWLQDVGAGAASLSPQGIKGALSKKLMPSKVQQEAYNLLKTHGLSDKVITPFIQNKTKSRILAKWGQPFLNRESLSKDLSSIADKAYESINVRGKKIPDLTGMKKAAFLHEFQNKLEKIPYFHKDLIEKDIERLVNSPINWKNLRDFELAINNKIKSTEGGKEVLGILKEPINLAEKSISKDLFNEKQILNKIYSSGKSLIKKLPKESEGHIITNADKLGSLGALAYSLFQGNPILLKGMAIKKGSEFAASQLLKNPRFQNMRLKLGKALSENNESVILNLTTKMLESLDKFAEKSQQTDKQT